MPIEPPPSRWGLDASRAEPGEDLVGIGADLEPGTILAAYRSGLFPMGLGPGGGPPLGWWSPDPRGVLLPGDLHVSRSLRRSLRHFEVRVDTSFAEVVAGCASPGRDGGWITPRITRAYERLHALGWAHSVETWLDGELVGGLYGLAVGRLFAAESKYHRVTDASKAAVVGLVRLLEEDGQPWLLDVQWRTDHLATLGVREVSRTAYLEMVARTVSQELPRRWRGPAAPRDGDVPQCASGDGMVSPCHDR